jgi:hypothetical protein
VEEPADFPARSPPTGALGSRPFIVLPLLRQIKLIKLTAAFVDSMN